MKNREVVQYISRMDHLFKQTSTLFRYISESFADPELQSHWAKYLCILTSGFIEIGVREIYSDYAMKSAHPTIANYVETQLSRFSNPNVEKIFQLARQFNPKWAEELERSTKGEIQDAINAVVANRNKIAHGESVGITFRTIEKYYQNSVKFIELLEQLCNP